MFASGRRLILIGLFTGLLIVLVNLVWWFNYERTESMLDEALARRLAAVAGAATVSFTPDDVDSLRMGGLEAFLNTISRLERIRQADSLSEVFVIDEDYYYLATTLLEPDSLYFLAAPNAPYIDSVRLGLARGAVTSPTYRSGNIYLKSAFAALEASDPSDNLVLGVEANVEYFAALTDLKQNLYLASALSLLGGLLLGLLFIWIQRRLNLAEQKLFLSETHAHLGRMVAVVAHEIKNPLMIIRGSAERLRKKTDMEEAGYVIEEIDRLNEIVSGYLDFAGDGETPAKTETPGRIDLNELINLLKKHVSEKYSDTPIQWLEAGAPDGATMTGYRRSLRQVLLNLLFNGVESCLEAGKPVAVGLAVSLAAGRVSFKVSDHGPGMSRAAQRNVFNPFYTTKQTGSGLGLYLSRRLVEQMGGRMSLDTQEGRGTVVTVELPAET